jgi:hypothetical protein
LSTPVPIRSVINVQLANKRSVAFPIVISFSDNNFRSRTRARSRAISCLRHRSRRVSGRP